MIVTGRLEQRSWETPDGDKRSKVEVVADEIGPSIRWATAQVTKNERRGPGDGPSGGGGGGGRGGGGQGGQSSGGGAPPTPGTDTARSLSSHGEEQRSRRQHRTAAPKDTGRAHQEEALRPVQGPGRVGRLQGRRHAAQVHERPGQDPRPSGVGQLHPAPAGRGHRHQDGPRARLLPYTQRTTTERPGGRGGRGGRDGGFAGGGGRRGRDEERTLGEDGASTAIPDGTPPLDAAPEVAETEAVALEVAVEELRGHPPTEAVAEETSVAADGTGEES